MAYSPENNPYIPGDPYSYDLKWVVKEIDKWKISEDSAEQAAASAQEASDQAEAAAASALSASNSAENAASSEASAKNYAEHIADPVAGLVSDWLADNITQPTTPAIDASLTVSGAAADAKAAGDAIRENDTVIDASLEYNTFNILDGGTVDETTLLNYQDGSTSPSNAFFTITADISSYGGALLHTYNSAASGTTYTRFAFFDSADSYISGAYPNEASRAGIPIPLNASKIKVCISYVGGNVNNGKPTEYWASIVYPKDDNAYLAPVVNYNKKMEVFTTNRKARKAVVSFTLDGEHDYNQRFVNVATKKGIRIGLAPAFNTNFPYQKLGVYKTWEKYGHEILVHSGVNIGSGSPYTEQEIADYIKNAYDTFTGYGFNIRGFVAYQGNSTEFSRNEASKYFDYGYMMANHAGQSAAPLNEPCIYIDGTSRREPMTMFRYSMQGSTLQQQKDAVDLCISTGSLLNFYGHAESSDLQNMTLANFESIIDYCIANDVTILPPWESVQQYFSARSTDIFNAWKNIISDITWSGMTLVNGRIYTNRALQLSMLNIRIRPASTIIVSSPLVIGEGFYPPLGRYYLNVNIPGINAYIYDNGKLYLEGSATITAGTDIYISGIYWHL